MKKTFRVVIEDAGAGGAFATVPFDVERVFGKKRASIKAAIDGEPYRGSLVRMGGGRHIPGIWKAVRDKIGKSVGDEIEITVEEAMEPREAAVPNDLRKVFTAHPGSESLFQKLSYSHQKEYVRWIDEAKREEIRAKRVLETIRRLGKK